MNDPANASPDLSALPRLQDLLETLPSPLEPLDASALDGYLCGVLLQPTTIPLSRWFKYVLDVEGRSVPGVDFGALREAVQLRHAELDRAIAHRRWFDPWIFASDDDATPPSEVVATWVAGFALAMEHFPALMTLEAAALTQPLALLYRHLDPEDLEDADDLLAEIDTLEPPEELGEAVEDLVRATLLLADVSRPLKRPPAPSRPARRRR